MKANNKSELELYLDMLSGGNIEECLELGDIASSALAKHLEIMRAGSFSRDIESNGVTYRVSVDIVSPKMIN